MSRDEILISMSDFSKKNSNKYGILRLGVFGSVARDTMTESSDVDVVVELTKPDLFIISDIKQDLESLLGKHVDVVRKRNSMNPFLKKRIEQEALYV